MFHTVIALNNTKLKMAFNKKDNKDKKHKRK